MKPIRWTHHAETEMLRRDIERSEAEKAIHAPDAVVPASWGRSFCQRRYHDVVLSAAMLLRVLVEETELETVVITLYKTSKIGKYEGGNKPCESNTTKKPTP